MGTEEGQESFGLFVTSKLSYYHAKLAGVARGPWSVHACVCVWTCTFSRSALPADARGRHGGPGSIIGRAVANEQKMLH